VSFAVSFFRTKKKNPIKSPILEMCDFLFHSLSYGEDLCSFIC